MSRNIEIGITLAVLGVTLATSVVWGIDVIGVVVVVLCLAILAGLLSNARAG